MGCSPGRLRRMRLWMSAGLSAQAWIFLYRITKSASWAIIALVAQLVEHLICNQGVPGSNPGGGTIYFPIT